MVRYFKYFIVIGMMILAPLSVLAQNTVTGRVIDSNAGEALVGVTVGVNGTSRVAITDAGGAFRIEASPSDVLTFALVGYTNQTVAVGGRTRIDVQLDEAAVDIDEVVVVGYGVMRKSDLTSSITKIDGDDVAATNTGNVGNALQGMAPGVLVVSGSGIPGSEPTVMIRGISSINLSSQPLYVVDGMPGNTSISDLNPADIESIEVLKDASASAIYGSLASNGVIMITTKKGLVSKPSFSADFVYGFQAMKPTFDMAGPYEYAQVINTAFTNAGVGVDKLPFANPEQYKNQKGTPWWETGIARTSPQINANFSVRGGTDAHKYSLSLSYYQQDSFYKQLPKKGTWQRLTARISNDWNFAKWISTGIMLNPRFDATSTPTFSSANSDNTANWSTYLTIDPITPIYKPVLTGDENEWSIYARSEGGFNPVATNKRFFESNKNYGAAGNAYVDIKPIAGLVVRSYLGFDYRFRSQDHFHPDFIIDAAHEKLEVNQVERWHDIRSMFSWQNTATYLKTFNQKHNLTLMAGMTMDRSDNKTLYGTKNGIPNNMDALRELDAATISANATGNWTINRSLMSFFGRVNYNYDNRYLVTATIRRDGSSKFMTRNKWATFPSASFAWNIANESFMDSAKDIFNVLKLRLGWGRVGNQNLPSAVYQSMLSQAYYVYNDSAVTTSQISTLKNEDIKWETVEDFSTGLDFTLWNGKFGGSVDYYVKTTRDMLLQKQYPLYSGYPSSARIWTNVGSMRSKGWDINFSHRNKVGEVSYNVALNLTTFNIKVTDMDSPVDGAPIINTTTNRTRTEKGEEPGYFLGYKSAGLFQTQAEVDSYVNESGAKLLPNAKPGDIRFLDTNNDGRINGDDRVKIGSPWADFTAGLNINVAWKGFDLMAMLYASYGNELVNWDIINSIYNGAGYNNKITGISEIAWHGEGTSDKIPILNNNDFNENFTRFNGIHVEDGSYLRLKNLQIGYTLPKSMTEKIGFSRVRVYASGLNLFTITNFSGTDPEIAGGGVDGGFAGRGFGFAGWSYPQLRTFLFGFNLNF